MTNTTSIPIGADALSRDTIRAIFLAHGFTVKEGQTDLKPYVYEAAEALIRAALVDVEPVAWLSVDCIGERYLCFTKPHDSDSALDRLLRFDAALRAAGASLPPPAPSAACTPGLDVALALLQGHIAAARAAR